MTCDPAYYKWNQWFFLQFLKAGLAYRQNSPVDFCPNDGTLAREQVEGVDRRCWRCGAKVEKRDLDQWYLRVTKYADELLDFSEIQFPDPIRHMQTNWIGRSEGAEIAFAVARDGGDKEIRVFTTRPDTLFGATFMVLAPEHPLVAELTAPDRRAEVHAYVAKAQVATEIERLSTDRDEDRRGDRRRRDQPDQRRAHPHLHRRLRPGDVRHRRDHGRPGPRRARLRVREAARAPIRQVVAAGGDGAAGATASDSMAEAYVAHSDDEILVNSGEFSGLAADEGGKRIVASLEALGKGKPAVTYRLRDWLVSRQRYWGTPIPVIHCPTHGIVPVPEKDLPVLLPDTVDYAGVGVNPLTRDEAFLNVTCPIDGEPAKRETDTMDTFMDFELVLVPLPVARPAGSPDRPRPGRDVDARPVLHRRRRARRHAPPVWARVHQDGPRPRDDSRQNEPWKRVFNQGQILGADGERMSKSRGNVQDPDEYVQKYGADTVRLFLMFMGPWDQGGPWSPTGIGGVHRFLTRVWALALDPHYKEPGDPDAGTLPDGQDEAAARAALPRRGPSHAARRHGGLREVSLQHDGREADGAVEHPVPVSRLGGHQQPGMGRGDPDAAADAGAGGAACDRGAVVAAAGCRG